MQRGETEATENRIARSPLSRYLRCLRCFVLRSFESPVHLRNSGRNSESDPHPDVDLPRRQRGRRLEEERRRHHARVADRVDVVEQVLRRRRRARSGRACSPRRRRPARPACRRRRRRRMRIMTIWPAARAAARTAAARRSRTRRSRARRRPNPFVVTAVARRRRPGDR